MSELKPCPFCGGEVYYAYTGSSDHEIICVNDDCGFEYHTWVSGKKFGYGGGEVSEAKRRYNEQHHQAQLKAEQEKVLELKTALDELEQDNNIKFKQILKHGKKIDDLKCQLEEEQERSERYYNEILEQRKHNDYLEVLSAKLKVNSDKIKEKNKRLVVALEESIDWLLDLSDWLEKENPKLYKYRIGISRSVATDAQQALEEVGTIENCERLQDNKEK